MENTFEIKIGELRKLFKLGYRMTSFEINKRLSTVDSRKMISRLRQGGMNIQDEWQVGKKGVRYKLYYL